MVSGLSRGWCLGPDGWKILGPEVRNERRLHHPESGSDHHGQEGGRTQAKGHVGVERSGRRLGGCQQDT